MNNQRRAAATIPKVRFAHAPFGSFLRIKFFFGGALDAADSSDKCSLNRIFTSSFHRSKSFSVRVPFFLLSAKIWQSFSSSFVICSLRSRCPSRRGVPPSDSFYSLNPSFHTWAILGNPLIKDLFTNLIHLLCSLLVIVPFSRLSARELYSMSSSKVILFLIKSPKHRRNKDIEPN